VPPTPRSFPLVRSSGHELESRSHGSWAVLRAPFAPVTVDRNAVKVTVRPKVSALDADLRRT
jgi:hypothetical protein